MTDLPSAGPARLSPRLSVLFGLAVQLGLYSSISDALADAAGTSISPESITTSVRNALDALEDVREHLVFIGSRGASITPPAPA